MRLRPLRLRAPIGTRALRAIAGRAKWSLDATAHAGCGSKLERWVAQKQRSVTAKSVQMARGIGHHPPNGREIGGASEDGVNEIGFGDVDGHDRDRGVGRGWPDAGGHRLE